MPAIGDPWLTLLLPQPGVPPSENEIRGQHWSSARAKLHPWRDAAAYTAMAARKIGFGTPSNVSVTLQFDVVRRRDPHNYVSTVVKAIVDGLVLARVWPDDTPEWVEVVEPRIEVVTKPPLLRPLITTIRLTARSMQ